MLAVALHFQVLAAKSGGDVRVQLGGGGIGHDGFDYRRTKEGEVPAQGRPKPERAPRGQECSDWGAGVQLRSL
ncbi:hypothetical protein GCM10009107_33550 [Ideonella azotifigens]|uniref:Secreted protein n=1 Tax=Ideonella azotifigens TaxID=513160 RepID=A0ABP3VFM8_9BURK